MVFVNFFKKLLTLLAVTISYSSSLPAETIASEIAKAHLAQLQNDLAHSYQQWRDSMILGDFNQWSASTAKHRKVAIKNRIMSEKRPFPQSLFLIPTPPPSIEGLKCLASRQQGATALAIYFGKVDFGVGGSPQDNLLLLSFLHQNGGWKYDTADYLSLAALPDVRKQLKEGNLDYISHKDFYPSGVSPRIPLEVPPAKWIAKVFVFSPGREVRVSVNGNSRHRFQDNKAAEVVIGGAVDRGNQIQFTTKSLEGSSGKEPLRISVFLMSQVPGVNPVNIYEYKVEEGGEVTALGKGTFDVSPANAAHLLGK